MRLGLRPARIAAVVFLMIALVFSPVGITDGYAKPRPPGISAESAALIDVESGRILYSRNGQKRMRIASLTKIMTAIVAIEETKNLDVNVRVPDEAVGTEGSSIYLKKGEVLTLRQLLYGLMLRSGNDAAVAIADYVGGSVGGFAYLMNEKARYLGLQHTHFTNPHGLDDSDRHYSTAADFARLTAYALQHPVFQKIVATKTTNIPWDGGSGQRTLRNKNKMLWRYKGADGVKTGYTRLAKRCLASSATRNGRQLAVITLNDPHDWKDHAALLDYGFQHFQPETLIRQKQSVKKVEYKGEQVEVIAKHPFVYPLAEGEKNLLTYRVEWNVTPSRFDSFKKETLFGFDRIGTLHIALDGERIGSLPLVLQPVESTTGQSFSFRSHLSDYWETMFRFGER